MSNDQRRRKISMVLSEETISAAEKLQQRLLAKRKAVVVASAIKLLAKVVEAVDSGSRVSIVSKDGKAEILAIV